MFPNLQIDINGIKSNIKKMQEMCKKSNIKLSVVTKVLVANKMIVKDLVESGVQCICESRIQNLEEYKDINVEKWLIREPMLCEIEDVVEFSDASLNSEIITIKALNEEAKRQNKIHKVILMYELGDLREGADEKEIEELVKECIKLENIELYGIGCNLSCYGSIMPSKENMQELADLANYLEEKFNIKFSIVSGGNSTSFEMVKDGTLPNKINNLRMGESIFLGNIPCIEKPINEFNRDNFILNTQIVEIKEKPSIPRGNMGFSNSFGEATKYIDKGIRKRALIGIGKQDFNLDGLIPVDENIEVIGGSSDYAIIDITDSKNKYKIGDIISFKINYQVLLGAMRK